MCELDIIFNFHKVRTAVDGSPCCLDASARLVMALSSWLLIIFVVTMTLQLNETCLLDFRFDFWRFTGLIGWVMNTLVPRRVTVAPQAYYILDEILIGGYLQEVNKREILRNCATQDDMMEEPKDGASSSPVAAPAMFR